MLRRLGQQLMTRKFLLKNCCYIALAAMGVASPASTRGQAAVSDARIAASIRSLAATPTDNLPNRQFEVFYENPVRSTELLIGSLKPVARGEYLTGQHPQSVWIIRALRSLTGLDFRAVTTADLSSDEAHFLGTEGQKWEDRQKVEFFGTWMSRDTVWVAPRDAQIAIIREWRDWFAAHGHDYKYVNDRNVDHWYF